MSKLPAVLNRIAVWTIITTFSIIPVFFLPITGEFYDTNKWMLLNVSVIFITLIWAIRIFVTKNFPESATKSETSGFIALFVAAMISLIIISTNKIEALLTPVGPVTFLSCAMLIYFTGIFLEFKHIRYLFWGQLVAGVILSLTSIYSFFELGQKLFPEATYLAGKLWTPIGSSTILIAYLFIVLTISFGMIRSAKHKSSENELTWLIIISVLIFCAVLITSYQFFPKYFTTTLPFHISWIILLETYKTMKNAVFGVGPENYLSAFSMGKSAIYNQTPVWNLRFNMATSFFLHIATTLGIIGVSAFLVLVNNLVRPLFFKKDFWWSLSAILSLITLLFIQPHIAVIVLTALILIAKPGISWEKKYHRIPGNYHWISVIPLIITIIISIFSVYLLSRFYRADVIFAKSLKEAVANQGTNAYNLQSRAISLNPYISSYHMVYARINVVLATGIANQAKSKSNNTNEQVKLNNDEQKLIVQLLKQAVEQAKIATALSPDNPVAWETMANIYQNISGIATNAETWTVSSYQKAIQLDPANPNLRFALAGVYLTQGQFDAARIQLEIAVGLKPDIANYYYNLAFIYRNLKQYQSERLALEQTLKLIGGDSPDAPKVKDELAKVNQALGENLPATPDTATPPEVKLPQKELTLPETQPAVEITPKIELPQAPAESTNSALP